MQAILDIITDGKIKFGQTYIYKNIKSSEEVEKCETCNGTSEVLIDIKDHEGNVIEENVIAPCPHCHNGYRNVIKTKMVKEEVRLDSVNITEHKIELIFMPADGDWHILSPVFVVSGVNKESLLADLERRVEVQ